MMRVAWQFAVVGLATAATTLGVAAALPHAPWQVQAEESPGTAAYYTTKVVPILQANCYRCHGGVNHRGGLNMATRQQMLLGGHHGPALVPGHPEQSWMVRLIRHEGPSDDPMNMPPAPKAKLTDAEIATVEAWVRAGAAVPAGDPPMGLQ